MSLEFGVAEIIQRTKDDDLRPAIGFDRISWMDPRKGGAVSGTIVDVQAANTQITGLVIPRTGLYRFLASVSCGVVTTVRLVRFSLVDAASNPLIEHRLAIRSSMAITLPIFQLFLVDGDIIRWETLTAMVLGDDLTGSITNWEIAT